MYRRPGELSHSLIPSWQKKSYLPACSLVLLLLIIEDSSGDLKTNNICLSVSLSLSLCLLSTTWLAIMALVSFGLERLCKAPWTQKPSLRVVLSRTAALLACRAPCFCIDVQVPQRSVVMAIGNKIFAFGMLTDSFVNKNDHVFVLENSCLLYLVS